MRGFRQLIGLSIFWLAESLIAAEARIDAWKIAEELGPMTEQELNGMTAIERATTPSTAYVFEKGLGDALEQDSVNFRDVDGKELVVLGYLIGVARNCDGSGADFVSTAIKKLESEIQDLQRQDLGKWLKAKTSILKAQTRGEKLFSGKLLPSYQNSLCPKILARLSDRLNLRMQTTNGHSLLDRMTTIIVSNWVAPESYYRASYVDIKIRINRDGSVQGVEFLNADADVEFKKAAVVAVLNSAPFHEVSGLDDSTFESKYQTLTIKFKGN